MFYLPIKILTTDGTIGCVLTGRCIVTQVLWQIVRPCNLEHSIGYVWDVTPVLLSGSSVSEIKKDDSSPLST